MSKYRQAVETPTVSRLPAGTAADGRRLWLVSARHPPLRWAEVRAHNAHEAERVGRKAIREKYPNIGIKDSEPVHVKCLGVNGWKP